MKLALYQGPSPAGDMALALKKVESVLSSAAMSDVQMVVFPELFLPGYNQPDLHHSMAQPQGGEWEQALRDIANTCGCGLTIGWAESDNGRYYNAASCFDQAGNKIAHYRKLQLFGAMEKTNFEFGESYTTFQWADFKVALLICYDVEFSHHVQRLKNQGGKSAVGSNRKSFAIRQCFQTACACPSVRERHEYCLCKLLRTRR